MKDKLITVFHAAEPGIFNLAEQVRIDTMGLTMYQEGIPNGRMSLGKVKGVSLLQRQLAVDEGISKYNSWQYLGISTLPELLIEVATLGILDLERTTYCSKLVSDMWKDQGIILDDADKVSLTPFVSSYLLTPDELFLSDNLDIAYSFGFNQ